jgi:hypothetical protein
VNQAARNMESPAQQPEQHKNGKDSPKHAVSQGRGELRPFVIWMPEPFSGVDLHGTKGGSSSAIDCCAGALLVSSCAALLR